MAILNIDGTEIEVPDHYTLLQACEAAGAEIPRFCYHERLSIAGNCRMCLVEVKGGPPKPSASCAMGVRDLRPGPNGEPPVVLTKSPMVKKAREGVMEFLLINHPLDCPICDQGGECDLQDQAMAYGIDRNRFSENKRAVEDKYIGPLVRTKMTRCIHCTRCVRFTTEVAGISELGLTGRGEDAEITTFLERSMTSELQGNVIDLCPVGALTSRPYQDTARPWELTKTESIDVMDAVGSNIRIDSRGRAVMRILPRLNEAVNEEWISDKSRFHYDGLAVQRLDRPYLRRSKKLSPAGWNEALSAIARKIAKTPAEKIGIIAGDLSSVEDMYAAKKFMASIGSPNMDCRRPLSPLHPKFGRASYVFNATIDGIEESDALLIVGANPRHEASVLNARIRKRFRMRGDYPIALIGAPVDLRYDYEHLGTGPAALDDLLKGKSRFAAKLKKAKRPLILVGQGALNRPDGEAILAGTAKLAVETGATTRDWNGYSILHTAAAAVGGLDIGFVPGEGGSATAEMLANMELLFLLGCDELDLSGVSGTIVYIGSHGDNGASKADIVLPGSAYSEKPGIYVNTEGRVQMASRAIFAPNEAKEEWAIFRALSGIVGKPLAFDSLPQLRDQLIRDHPLFQFPDEIAVASADHIAALAKSSEGKFGAKAFEGVIDDFYLTNPIARASRVMAECSRSFSAANLIAAE
jgi:NADH-quinone oxidoreductase subunit G